MNTDQELPARIEVFPTHLHLFHCEHCRFRISSRDYQRAAVWLAHHILVVHVLAGRALKEAS